MNHCDPLLSMFMLPLTRVQQAYGVFQIFQAWHINTVLLLIMTKAKLRLFLEVLNAVMNLFIHKQR